MGKQGVDLGVIPIEEQPIGDADWFKLSKTWVTGYEERLKEQVKVLQETIKWFFTISSSATIISAIFKTPHINFISTILLSIALLSLLISFSLSTLTVTLVSKSIEAPGKPDAIRKEFNRSNRISKNLLVSASVLLVIGMTVFPIAVVTAYEEQTITKKPLVTAFTAQPVIVQDKADGRKRNMIGIEISGVLADSSILRLRLEKGKDMFHTITIDSLSHQLIHAHFDLSVKFNKVINLDPAVNYYVTLLEKNNAGTRGQTMKLVMPL